MREEPFTDTTHLVAAAATWLKTRLPATWSASTHSEAVDGDGTGEAALELRPPSGPASWLPVTLVGDLSPREAKRLVRQIEEPEEGSAPAGRLVVAPWISPETQRVLTDRAIAFIDLTGNAWVSLTEPALHVSSVGATERPTSEPLASSPLQRRGAICLMRYLVDVAPPYRVRRLAEETGLSAGYVSQLLKALEGEGLIKRGSRGRVDDVEITQVLLRMARSYDPIAFNEAHRFQAPQGIHHVLAGIQRAALPVVLTGAVAAAQLVPTLAPRVLVAYADAALVASLAPELEPAESDANVVLLEPFDPALVSSSWSHDGLTYAAVPQIAVDCLTIDDDAAAGAAPEVLEWLHRDPRRWRRESSSAAPPLVISPVVRTPTLGHT